MVLLNARIGFTKTPSLNRQSILPVLRSMKGLFRTVRTRPPLELEPERITSVDCGWVNYGLEIKATFVPEKLLLVLAVMMAVFSGLI